jgi:signal transduction histidine kinase
MTRKFTIVLVVLAIIPIGLLSWMGFASIQAEKDRSKQQIKYLGNQQLEIVRDNIKQSFMNLEMELNQVLDLIGSDIDELRNINRNHNLISQIFILNEEGLVYPSGSTILSNKEEAFLVRIRETDISFDFLQKSKTEKSGEVLTEGWHTWFMGDGINFIFWKKLKLSDGSFIIQGVELNRAAVLSSIINYLPDTNEENTSFQIKLKNINSTIQYQWGLYSPLLFHSPDAVLPLEDPLKSWHLEYSINPLMVNFNSNRLFLLVSILTILSVVIALSIYLYRESTRETREASQKVSFVNQVSHELKTPLTNIRMYAELLEKRLSNEDSKTKKHLGIIISESNRLSRLINNVLSFAKGKKNGIKFNPVLIAPDKVILRTLDSFMYSLKTKNIKVFTKLKTAEPKMIDTDILEQILSNLFSNVEKYAAKGKWIKVESSIVSGADCSNVQITISDKGQGIAENVQEKIFEPFFRISNKLTDGVSGTGIGLSLVRKLAKIHGGDVILLSSNEPVLETGAVFQISLESPEENRDSVPDRLFTQGRIR